jgi:hypothetical protein
VSWLGQHRQMQPKGALAAVLVAGWVLGSELVRTACVVPGPTVPEHESLTVQVRAEVIHRDIWHDIPVIRDVFLSGGGRMGLAIRVQTWVLGANVALEAPLACLLVDESVEHCLPLGGVLASQLMAVPSRTFLPVPSAQVHPGCSGCGALSVVHGWCTCHATPTPLLGRGRVILVDGGVNATVFGASQEFEVSYAELLVAPTIELLGLTPEDLTNRMADSGVWGTTNAAVLALKGWVEGGSVEATESPILGEKDLRSAFAKTVGYAPLPFGKRTRVQEWRPTQAMDAAMRVRVEGVWRDATSFPSLAWRPNGYFASADDAVAFAMIVLNNVQVVVEVGCGWSSRPLRAALHHLGGERHHICIDPFGDERQQSQVPPEVRYSRIQSSANGLSWTDWQRLFALGRAALFIDSSHVAAPLGDVERMLLEVVPRMSAGSLVHVHDVALPLRLGHPNVAARYSEPALLAALLMAPETKFRVEFPVQAALVMDAESRAFATDDETNEWWGPRDGSPLDGSVLEGCSPNTGSSLWFSVGA